MPFWKQFQSNGPSQGFVPFSTGPIGSLKWTAEVGPVSFASPVIGGDGTVYIGNLKAELTAVAPNGSLKWKRTLAERGHTIAASCVIDSAENLYVITTYRATVRDHRSGHTVMKKEAHSKLHSLTKDGALRWTFEFPLNNATFYTNGYCLSAPKLINKQSPIIFVPAFYSNIAGNPKVELLAIDHLGNLLQRTVVADYPLPPVEVSGGGISGVLEEVWDFLNGAEFEPRGEPNLPEKFGWPQPSIAVADFGPWSSRPVILFADNYQRLSSFRWQNGEFVPLWSKVSEKPLKFSSSPAIFLSSMAAVGQKNGYLEMYDLLSGQEVWKPWYQSVVPIQSPAACFLSQIFVVSGLEVIALDANGKLINKRRMDAGAISAPAISADRVFINGGDGLYSFSLDLNGFTKNNEVVGGVSSPAIASDGTVFVVDRNKTLWAFGGSSVASSRPAHAQVV